MTIHDRSAPPLYRDAGSRTAADAFAAVGRPWRVRLLGERAKRERCSARDPTCSGLAGSDPDNFVDGSPMWTKVDSVDVFTPRLLLRTITRSTSASIRVLEKCDFEASAQNDKQAIYEVHRTPT